MTKKLKILFVDPFSWEGHINFNKIHIDALKNIHQEVEFSFIEGYGDKLGLSSNDIINEIPLSLTHHHGKFGFRFSQFRILIYLKKLIKNKKYDKVIFSCYEPISFMLSGIKKAYIINHDTITENIIKKYCLRSINKYNIHIYMMKSIKLYFNSLECNNLKIQFINHGLLKHQQLPHIETKKKFLFSPSISSTDFAFIRNMLKSKKLINYLETNGFELVIRSNEDFGICSESVRIITKRLTDQEYMLEMTKAHAIFLCYQESFTYRVSGVLMEAFAYNKTIIANTIPALTEFQEFIGSNFLYQDVETLIKALDYSKQGKIKGPELASLTPDYSFLLT